MRTSPLVDFSIYDPTIKPDGTPSATDIQPFSKIEDLEIANSTQIYATYEPDFWLLDGKYKLMPMDTTNVHVGYMSLSISDIDGTFDTPPTLTITFGSIHDIDGITLNFSQYTGDWCNFVKIRCYNNVDALIDDSDYTPSTWNFYTNQPISAVKKIVVIFNGSNNPYRYVRLASIDYGQVIHFTGTDIKSCVVVEEVNPLSTELPIGTLELSLFSSDAAFSIINPTGDYENLQNKQPLNVYEVVGNDQIFIGQFFLDSWENPSDNIITFRAIDMLGILDSVPYLGGLWGIWNPDHTSITFPVITAGDLIEEMMSAINTPYDLDPSLESIEITGWIPVCSYREALQQIGFAIGAYITCSRSGVLKIYASILASELSVFDYAITKADKGINQSLTLKPLVTGIELAVYNYIPGSDAKMIYSGYLTTGDHIVFYTEPAYGLSFVGGGFGTVTQYANYASVNITVAGVKEIWSQGYQKSFAQSSLYNTGLDANVKPNIIKIDGVTIVNPDNAATIVQRIYDYYLQRYLQKVKLYAPEAAAGDSVLIDTLYDRQIGAIIEKMTLDLSGGFTAKAEATGVIIPI